MKLVLRLCLVSAMAILLACSSTSQQKYRWWDSAWNFRIGIEVTAGQYERHNKPVEVEFDIVELLREQGVEGTPDHLTPRLIETGPDGRVLDENVPCQFDPGCIKKRGNGETCRLTFLLTGETAAASVRTYELYFDTLGGVDKTPASVDTLVWLEEIPEHEGQPSYRITSPSATWYYHTLGGGFASIEDRDGNDWIGFRPCCESDGEYRGIPNLWKFHPGYDSVASRVEIRGPLAARIRSISHDAAQEVVWDIFPDYARMTLLAVDSTYWFLYEGTPGGSLEVDRDYNVISSGLRRPVAESWQGDLPAPEWIYFGDDSMRRTLYLVHDDDDKLDQFWQMREQMVVFGFGREYPCCGTYMDKLPATFTVGLAEDSTFAAVSRVIDNAWRPLQVRVSPLERRTE